MVKKNIFLKLGNLFKFVLCRGFKKLHGEYYRKKEVNVKTNLFIVSDGIVAQF